jgi:hypothetical protein
MTAACGGEPVGRPCFIPGLDAGTVQNANILASPALECQSRTCLHIATQQAGRNDLCTARCESDDDCEKVPESPCEGGFTCAVAVEVGPFCCQKFCQCKDYLIIPDGGLPDPVSCDPNNAINECCNLAGRRDEANQDLYPHCFGAN